MCRLPRPDASVAVSRDTLDANTVFERALLRFACGRCRGHELDHESGLKLDHHALRFGQLDRIFRFVGQELREGGFDACQDRVVVRDHDAAGDHSRVEVLQAGKLPRQLER